MTDSSETMRLEDLQRDPHPLHADYRHFRVGERLLLTGHSHQAWPDVGLAAQRQAWLDAAEHVDEKWERAFAKAKDVARGYAGLLGDPHAEIALASSTHDLVIRWLSALPLRTRPRLLTSDGEFHTIRRQLARLEEEGIEIVRVPSEDPLSIAERLVEALDERCAGILVSAVLFQTAEIVPGLHEVMDAARACGARLLVDAYHALDVIPFSLAEQGLEEAYVVGGGYKYCQLGEGNAFLRLPPDDRLRPAITGWFAEFETLEGHATGVAYGSGARRFAGATYDPTSHYRAAAVMRWFREKGLTPELLRAISLHQVGRLAAGFDALDLDPSVLSRDRALPPERRAGFLVLRSTRAAELCRLLRARGVHTDHRGDALRLGPAPYLSDAQLDEAILCLGQTVQAMG